MQDRASVRQESMSENVVRNSNLPLSNRDLEGLIAIGETDLIEFKRQWYDLDEAEGKARLTQDVLALSNTVRRDPPGDRDPNSRKGRTLRAPTYTRRCHPIRFFAKG